MLTYLSASGPLPISDRPAHRPGDVAVFDQIAFRGAEHEIAAGDVHLAAAESWCNRALARWNG